VGDTFINSGFTLSLMNNLDAIRDEVVGYAFPELIRIPIELDYESIDRAFLRMLPYGEGYFIGVDTGMKDVNPNVVRGGMAHELAHIVFDLELSFIGRLIDGLRYNVSPFYKSYLEKKTDNLVLERDMGPELLVFKNYVKKTGCTMSGISVKKTKRYLKRNS
jgi:hypothetical protein